MSKLSYRYKLTARTTPAIDQKARELLLRLQGEGWSFKSGPDSKRTKIGLEGMMGAILVDFLAQPVDARLDVLRRRLPEYEALLTGRFAPAEMRPLGGEGWTVVGSKEVTKRRPKPKRSGKRGAIG